MIGIYAIRSISQPDRVYIGSSIRIEKRLRDHESKLIKNVHPSSKLQNHVNKYGFTDLVLEPIIECGRAELIAMEQKFLDLFAPYFNSRPKAENNLGFKHSEESRKRLSESHKGLSYPRRVSSWNKGKKTPDALKRKLSEINKGQVPWNKGLTKADERVMKCAIAARKSGEKRKGVKLSDRHRKNLSEAGRRAWVLRKLKRAA